MSYAIRMDSMRRSTRAWLYVSLWALLGWIAMPQSVVLASDHADPMVLKAPDSNLTGLFFFPDGDRMVAVINVHRALSTPGPYDLSPFVITLHMDLESAVTFEDAEDRARYGGTVVDPQGLRSSAQIQLRLNDDASLKESKVEGLTDPDAIRVWSGVRDDPFIFPRFFGKNVISSVMSIPLSSFPAGQQDFVLWANVTRASDGVQIDHVGRSNRTQLGRLDFLNRLPPSEHVPAIMKKLEQSNKIESFLSSFDQLIALGSLYHYVLQLRRYDVFPDVMIYSTQFPPRFPNGRQLPDDVVGLTCEEGDCDLQELAFIEGSDWPRKTVNDKPFLNEFPYLAEPWPDTPASATAPRSLIPIIAGIFALVLGVLALVFWLGYRRGAAR